MSQISVSICVGDPDEPMVYVCHEQTVIVDSDDGQELILTAASTLGDVVEWVRSEAAVQLKVLAKVAASQ